MANIMGPLDFFEVSGLGCMPSWCTVMHILHGEVVADVETLNSL